MDITSVLMPARAARTAVAAAVVVFPTPPLPVKRMTRMRMLVAAGCGRQPSTRFLSSFSAVSMMTFSALRLSIPSIGILTSTARR